MQSLLALPYLGFLGVDKYLHYMHHTHLYEDKSDPAYVATRKVLLSRNNPYYAKGASFFGVG